MKYVEALLRQETYCLLLEELRKKEENRIYCRHDPEHFLQVARTAYIISLEKRCGIAREPIYLCALLHDIGRARQAPEGVTHQALSAMLAEKLLTDIQYPKDQHEEILSAIKAHGGRIKSAVLRERIENPAYLPDLSELIRMADQLSRNCFLCSHAQTCYWGEDEKNCAIYR